MVLTKMYHATTTFPRIIVYTERGCLRDELLDDMSRTVLFSHFVFDVTFRSNDLSV